jgi:hypothetical protein
MGLREGGKGKEKDKVSAISENITFVKVENIRI